MVPVPFYRFLSPWERVGLRAAALITACFLSGCVVRDAVDVPSRRYLDSPPWVRVLIVDSAREASVSVPQGTYVNGGGKATLCRSPWTTTSGAEGGSVCIGKKNTGYGMIRLIPPRNSDIRVNGRAYPGEISLAAAGDAISVVNCVNVEDYVAGVVAGEMPLDWDDDALCAQAVAARSFALNEKQDRSCKRWFDLYADERSQVYGGSVSDEKPLRAASATRGTIVVWNWRLFPTFYHSACGGQTRRAHPFLSSEDIAPLAGVRCPFCADVDTAWRKLIPPADLKRLADLPGKIDSIKVDAAPEGRNVKITCAGQTVIFSADEFRCLVGPKILRSPVFHARPSGTSWLFTGRGYGHGVGMCQHGARGMANRGYRWPSILRFYYPGAELVRVY